jgi:urea transporter
MYMEMDRQLLRKGLLSYNGVLVGSGVAGFLSFSFAGGWVVSIAVSVLAAPITLVAYVYTTSLVSTPLLFPANVVLIFMLLSAILWNGTSISAAVEVSEDEEAFHVVGALFRGMSQMFLVGGSLSGCLIALGMIPCSRILAGAALAGSLLGSLCGWFLWDTAYINVGMGGFNVALTCAALVYHIVPTVQSIAFLLLGFIWTIIVQSALSALYTILYVIFNSLHLFTFLPADLFLVHSLGPSHCTHLGRFQSPS